VRKPRKLPFEELAPYSIDFPSASPRRPRQVDANGEPVTPPRTDWSTLFGNTNPVEIEVGFGKGLFLVNAGVAQSGTNFFGIEIVRKYQLYAATRIALRQLTNVKTTCSDAKLVLRELVVPGSVAAVHVYFPDPWWKSRHKKRLLFTPDFADSVWQVLAPEGILHFVSDVADYFAMVTGILTTMPGFQAVPAPDATDPKHDMDYLTNFERKFRKEGRPIYRSKYLKVRV